MKIDVIDDFEAFSALREDWEAVYAADPEANVFLSWIWMSKWLPIVKSQWIILAAKPSERATNYVAFFPLRFTTSRAKNKKFYTEILMAGNRIADYTGLICVPQWSQTVIPAFVEAIKAMRWATIRFESLRMRDNNLKQLLNCFDSNEFDAQPISTVESRTGIDQSVCPYATLPNDWDDYLNMQSANSRQKLRRLLRQVENNPDLRITHTRAETLERDTEIFLELWGQQWKERKGDQTRTHQANCRLMLKNYHELGILFMPILWDGDNAVGALASVIDKQKRALHFYLGARDKAFNKPQPGLTLHAHSIRHAIGLGLKEYDFLRGNEDYKYTFASHDRKIKNLVLRLKSLTVRKSVFDARGIPQALDQVSRCHAEKDFAGAESGYRQILNLDPACARALWGYGQLKLSQGHIGAAKKLFDSIAATKERPDRVSLGLGQCQAAQGRWAYAKAYYQRAIKLNPKLVPAHYHLGLAHERKGELADAIDSYRKVISYQPDYRDAKVRLTTALSQARDTGAISHQS